MGGMREVEATFEGIPNGCPSYNAGMSTRWAGKDEESKGLAATLWLALLRGILAIKDASADAALDI